MKFFHIIEEFNQELKLKNLAKATIKTYSRHCLYLFQYYNKHPFEITEKQLKKYILQLGEKGNTAKSCNLAIFSIKCFYKTMDKRSLRNITTNIPRQKEAKNLPAILSKEEVVRMISSLDNIKHRAILAVAYSSGLRIQETCRLKVSDINSDRMTLLINGKGSKQRICPLCPEALKVLRAYYKLYRPKFWLFQGEDNKKPISSRTLYSIFKNSLYNTGIRKPATFHTLRHCYATHLLEAGTNLHSIQKLLGHKSIRSTLIYTHVAEEVIIKIKSPLNEITLPVNHVHMGRGGLN